eukprot:GHRQ01024586.1.p1 GENE.GHRQ01024586.1~~GHRQ01024586.1.p1  ORF type:complete len:141 (+),score=2.39 GHRQ01024586.1:63-425(+)
MGVLRLRQLYWQGGGCGHQGPQPRPCLSSHLVSAHTCSVVYGPGHKHFGAYGLGSDCTWLRQMARASSSDSWGLVAGAAAIEAVKEELAGRFQGWSLAQRMLERDVAVMIRVRKHCFRSI